MSGGKNKFKKIFERGFLGNLEVKNRLIMSAMGTRLASEIGGVSQRQIDYYSERAKGGVGTIITEVTSVDYPLGVTAPTSLTIHSDAYIVGHNELVEAVHTLGSKIICQLVHAGRQTTMSSTGGIQPVAPSAIPCKFLDVMPRELTSDEIKGIVIKFIEAAVRAKTAGYDGVELHGAHGYLIAGFMSANSNHRNDMYGGSFSRRMAFPLEIIQGIRKELGWEFPLLFRFSADEFVDGGRKLEESKKVAKILENAGVDALNVSAGTYDSMTKVIQPMSYPEACMIYLAESIKNIVKIPVIGVGVVRNPETAEEILKAGRVDFVALGRALLADPYWPQKAREGKEKEIIRCISCNSCIEERAFRGLHIRCALNPLTGREWLKKSIVPVRRRKKVFVIGGGPAGMMAALTAKRKDHKVTLYERTGELGGQLRRACVLPGSEKFTWFLNYLINQINREGIETILQNSVVPETIFQGEPDAVILASGAKPIIPDIPGISDESFCTAWQVLEGKKRIEDKEVLIVGAGCVGCETALYLAPENKKIIIVEMMRSIAPAAGPITRMDIISRIQQTEIEILLERKVRRIEKPVVVLTDKEKKEEQVEVDVVVFSTGVAPLNDLKKELEGKVAEFFAIGDCVRPRKIIDAVYEGFQAALSL